MALTGLTLPHLGCPPESRPNVTAVTRPDAQQPKYRAGVYCAERGLQQGRAGLFVMRTGQQRHRQFANCSLPALQSRGSHLVPPMSRLFPSSFILSFHWTASTILVMTVRSRSGPLIRKIASGSSPTEADPQPMLSPCRISKPPLRVIRFDSFEGHSLHENF